MKKLIFTIVLLSLFAFQPPKTTKLNGTWQVVSFKVFNNGTASEYISSSGSQIKTWSDKYFVFVGKYTDGDNVQNNFGGGTYSLEGTHYQEKIQYHVSQPNVGKTIKMLIELKNDTLIQSFPVDENWKVYPKNCQVEKYVRLD